MGTVDSQALVQRLLSKCGGNQRFTAVHIIHLISGLIGFPGVKRLIACLFKHLYSFLHTLPLGLSRIQKFLIALTVFKRLFRLLRFILSNMRERPYKLFL